MIRPWKVVLGAVLAVAALPGSAMARRRRPSPSPRRRRAPSIRRATPITASYACTDDVAGRPAARAPSPTARAISTATVGNFQFTVTGTDARRRHDDRHARLLGQGRGGRPRRRDAGDAEPHARHPGRVLAVRPRRRARLHDHAQRGDPLDGRERDAVRRRRERDRDRAPGQRRLLAAQPLQAAGTSAYVETTPGVMGPIGGSASPLTLLTYKAPTPGTDTATLNFKQSITGDRAAAHRRLREDADLHAVDDQPVGSRAPPLNDEGPPVGGPSSLTTSRRLSELSASFRNAS